MYNVHLTHSLLCFEFVEFTLYLGRATDRLKLPSIPDTAPLPGSSLIRMEAPIISSPVCASVTLPFMSLAWMFVVARSSKPNTKLDFICVFLY